jgi:hypothetical protein
LLKAVDLKNWLHRDELKQLDKLLLILATFDEPCQVKDIKTRAKDAGLKIEGGWNPSSTLNRSKGHAINTPRGWEITSAGKDHLRFLGVSEVKNQAAAVVADDLRAELSKITEPTTHAFVDEAIKCFEHKLFRSAIVMSWLAAIDVLYRYVVANRLSDFNAEATRVLGVKWKRAVNEDDLALMSERNFLDRIAHLSIIGQNVKTELIKCLDLRNGSGHPNSLKTGPNAAAHHIEILIQNVFQKFV